MSPLRSWLRLAAFGGALLASAPDIGATTYSVGISSPGFALSTAQLAFDFIDGGPPHNTVTLSSIFSNGTQGAASSSGTISGTPPWVFSDAGFFSELLVDLHPLGTSMSFSFTTTDLGPNGGSFPDAFSFFALDPTNPLNPFLITSNGPGSELFEADITGTGADGLHVYIPDQRGYSITVTAVGQAPEPGSLALLGAGLVAFFAGKRSNTSLRAVQAARRR